MRDTVHHGHFQGAAKRRGDHALCARCLARGDSHEETVVHAVHKCLESREVWSAVARTWEATTGEPLDVSNPTLTVFGLRPRPDAVSPRPCPGKVRRRGSPPGAYYMRLHS